MAQKKAKQEKTRLHPKNINRERYDLDALVKTCPELESYIQPNRYGDASVDFSQPQAVKILNKALLQHYYKIDYWEFPDENLCPPIPGRADYIHYLADLLMASNYGKLPKANSITCFDIGVGASSIYPLLGVVSYDWNFIASDVSEESIESARNIIEKNTMEEKIECRLQQNPKDIFFGIIDKDEKIDLSMCNPPFHASLEEAQKGSRRKVKNLSGVTKKEPTLNFSGSHNELIYKGGELGFITKMIRESKKFEMNCYWFSTLVSKQAHLKRIQNLLTEYKATEIKVIPMGTGNKSTRIIAWSFLDKEAQTVWRKRWN